MLIGRRRRRKKGRGLCCMHISATTNPSCTGSPKSQTEWGSLSCDQVCRASQLTGFYHHTGYLMSDCLWGDKIKLQAWLISATAVFFFFLSLSFFHPLPLPPNIKQPPSAYQGQWSILVCPGLPIASHTYWKNTWFTAGLLVSQNVGSSGLCCNIFDSYFNYYSLC